MFQRMDYKPFSMVIIGGLKKQDNLLQNLAEERGDEDGKDCTPKEGVDHHHHPPKRTAGGSSESVGYGIAGLSEKLRAFEYQKANEMNNAERNICKQKRFHDFSF